ncbi:hypothetical protein SAMN02745866_03036 [Alteromonadaceae bacterium Bs31]|nr:hypothetical protein SAMN02745866_03036 [Alteromonadaceae bacterium Bs31]
MQKPYLAFLFFALLCFSIIACSKQEGAQRTEQQSPTATQSQPQSKETAQTKAAGNKPANTQNIQILDISERSKGGKNGIAVTFSTEVDTSEDIQSYFVITQADQSKVEGAWVVADDAKLVWFMNTEPQSEYLVSVNPGLKAANGSTLLSGSNNRLSTRALRPSINFDSDGMILPLGYASGLPIVSVNIKQVDVDFFRVDDKKITDFVQFANRYGRKSWYTNRMTSFASLTYSARFDINPPKNTRTKRDIDIHNIDELKEPGLYLAVMRAAGEYDQREITWFSITDIGLHIRQYKNQLDIHTSSLTSGKPLSNVELEIYDNDNNIIHSNTSTADGLASFNGDLNAAKVLVAKTKTQYTVLNLTQAALDLSEFDLGSRPQLPAELFIYSPRDLYRPGETAIFSALLRNHDGKLGQNAVLTGDIRNPSGSTVKSFKWQGDELAYYQYSWNIPQAAPTGKWTLVVSGMLEKPVSYEFNVEEFLPERLKLTLAEGKERSEVLSTHEALNISVLGEYLYGAPAGNNKFGAMLAVSQWRDAIASLKGFEFGNLMDERFQRQQELPDIILDAEGKASLHIPSSWQAVKTPLKVNIVGSLYESGGRPVTRAHPVLIWPAETVIGIRPHFGDTNPEPNTVVKFDLVNATVKGILKPASNVEATLIREDRQYFWEYNQQRGWHWNYSEKEFPLATETSSIGDKASVISFPVEWGRYRLEVTNNDNNIMSSYRFFVGYNWYYDWKNASGEVAARPDKVNLALDKTAYKGSDTAQLRILPPADGEALILVESDRPLWSKKLAVSAAGSTVHIPIDESWSSHNIYISALLVQPSGDSKKTTPKRAMGLIHLPLDREQRKLGISIDAPEKVQPQTSLSAKLTIDKPGLKSRVSLAAVDVGVLSISNFETPDPFDYFFGQRRYSVDAKDIYADVIEAHQAEIAQQRFGGDADLVRGGKKPQSEVQIVSLFNGPVEFDSQGEATVKLDLPDFNGRIRLMAVAFGEHSFGSEEAEVTVAAPIIAEIAMPRFLAQGDKSTIALDVQNLTEQTQNLSINTTSEPPLKLDSKKQAITLAPKEKKTLLYPVEAIGLDGSARIETEISGQDIDNFTRSWALGVRPAYPAITENLQLLLKPGEHFSLSEKSLPGAIPSSLQASISLSPMIDLQVNNQLKNLLQYPYGCLEQTSSRAWPLTFATPENQARFGLKPLDESKRLEMIQAGIDRILSFQRNNGSFGLWGKDSPEEHWLSVYATDFLLNAKNMGMDVSDKALEKAVKRLLYYLNSSNTFIRQRWSNDPKHYAFSTRAYAAYVLAQINRAPLGTLRNLYNTRFDDANTGFSQIHLGLALLKMGDKKNGNEALRKALANFPEKYRYWGDYGSEPRDLAMSMYLLLHHNKEEDAALQLGLQLRTAIQNRRWLSTQERIALFMAGIALESGFGSSWQADWKIGDMAKQRVDTKGAWKKFLGGKLLQQGFSLESKHDQTLYLGAMVNGYSTQAPEAVNHGIEVQRNWYDIHGKAIKPEGFKTGDLALVHISISSDQRVPDALVINLLPAGLELENQNLEHAIKFDSMRIEGETVTTLLERTQLKHREFRDDRYVAAIDHNGYSESHLFFLVRAVTPGVYKVPPVIAEDMYRPEIRGISETVSEITVSE